MVSSFPLNVVVKDFRDRKKDRIFDASPKTSFVLLLNDDDGECDDVDDDHYYCC
jgi:hypothetical protein